MVNKIINAVKQLVKKAINFGIEFVNRTIEERLKKK
jgi:hypothetical protein